MNKILRLLVWPMIMAPAIYFGIKWKDTPDRVALHFNFKGEADRFGQKSELLVVIGILTLMAILSYVFLPKIYKIDPKKTAQDNRSRLEGLGFAVAALLSFVAFFIVHSAVHEMIKLPANTVLGAVGLFIAVCGNYMYNIKPNYFAGFRLPWTLNSEDNWRKTHRLVGKIWFLGGLIILIASFLLSYKFLFILIMSLVLLMVLIPMIYSYRLYREAKKV